MPEVIIPAATRTALRQAMDEADAANVDAVNVPEPFASQLSDAFDTATGGTGKPHDPKEP